MHSRKRNQRGLATWAKWLIGVVAVVMVLGIGIFCVLGLFAYNAVKDATNPEKARELAATMVTIKEPLPERYEFKVGMNIMETVKFVTIEDSTDNYSYSFVDMIQQPGEKVSAEELVEQLAIKGVPSSSGSSAKIEVQEKSSMTVAGVNMPYVMGITENKGQEVPALMGVIIPNEKNVLMLIVISPPGSKTVDIEKAKQFFNCITAFK